MLIERHDCEGDAFGGGLSTAGGEHFGVAEMDAVEVADAENAAAKGLGEGLPIREEVHGGSIRQEKVRGHGRCGGEPVDPLALGGT